MSGTKGVQGHVGCWRGDVKSKFIGNSETIDLKAAVSHSASPFKHSLHIHHLPPQRRRDQTQAAQVLEEGTANSIVEENYSQRYRAKARRVSRETKRRGVEDYYETWLRSQERNTPQFSEAEI